MRSLILGILLSAMIGQSRSQEVEKYWNHEALSQEVRRLADTHASKARLISLARSRAGRDLWLLEISSADEQARKNQPAMLLVAGAEGNDIASTNSALAWAKDLLGDSERAKALLAKTTFYVVPRLSVDAAERYFEEPRWESARDNEPRDEDHDGLLDEDGPEDLDGDGKISWMRVEDSAGEWITHPDEPRLMIKADPLKGEHGQWRLLREGRDNDEDGEWNEDGTGGVNPNRNFPYNYAWFAMESGARQLSDNLAKALADFVVGHPRIALTFTFGATDNLLGQPKTRDGDEANKPATGVHKDDLRYYQELGQEYRKSLGVGELGAADAPGTLADWLYFHRGRFSLGTRAWFPALALGLAKEEKKEEPKDKPAKEPDKRAEAERSFLRWTDKHQPTAFVPWHGFAHGDFPGKKVEIGGLAAFAESVPPLDLLGDLTKKHSAFLMSLAEKLPRIGILRHELKPLGADVYELLVTAENCGQLPTLPRHGEICNEVPVSRLTLEVADSDILAGPRKSHGLPTLRGGGTSEARYMLLLPNAKVLRLRIDSTLGGSQSLEIPLSQASSLRSL